MRAVILGLASQTKAGFWDDFWGTNDPTTTDYPTTTSTTSTQEFSGKKLENLKVLNTFRRPMRCC